MIWCHCHVFTICIDWVCIFIMTGITQILEMTDLSRERLEQEIVMLNKDRAEVTEQFNSVSNYTYMYWGKKTWGCHIREYPWDKKRKVSKVWKPSAFNFLRSCQVGINCVIEPELSSWSLRA